MLLPVSWKKLFIVSVDKLLTTICKYKARLLLNEIDLFQTNVLFQTIFFVVIYALKQQLIFSSPLGKHLNYLLDPSKMRKMLVYTLFLEPRI